MPIILALIALVVVSSLGFSIMEPKLEKLVDEVGDTANQTLDRVLNPGVLILAVVAIFLIVGGTSRGG